MRCMVIIKATADSEAGVMPSETLLAQMGRFNEELVQAGVMLAGEGLQPSAKGARVRFAGDRRTVIDGPFAETKELIAGFWIWNVASRDEAIAWVQRCPRPMEGDCEIEIRQVFEAADFGAALTPELQQQEERLRAQVARQAGGVRAVPPAQGALPYLVVKGAPDAIGWYERVFGARCLTRLDAPDGSVLHAQLEVGPASFMLTEERPQYQALGPLARGGSSSSAVLYVPDADAVFTRAVAAGATVTMPMADQFWGDRSGHLVDPFGHQWFISTHREDVSPAEMQQRMQAMMPPADCG